MSLRFEFDAVRVDGRTWAGGPLSIVRGSTFEISGWACDPQRYLTPEIGAQIDGSIEIRATRVLREDVGTHFQNAALSHAGFLLQLPTALSSTDHILSIGSFNSGRFEKVSDIGFTCVDSLTPSVQHLPPYESRLLSSLTNHDFMLDPRFISTMREVDNDPVTQKHGRHGDWTFHVLLWCAQMGMRLPGDIVHCGVCAGGEAEAMCSFIDFARFPQKTMYLLDTFTGVPEEQWTPSEIQSGADSAQWLYRELGDVYPSVVERFRKFPNVKIIQGRIPESLVHVDAREISLLYLDLNVAFPEAEALRILWERIVPGGLVLSDDYGHTHGPGHGYWNQKAMFDAFAAKAGLPVLTLPTGQGLLIKA